jgi:hypothetical protein
VPLWCLGRLILDQQEAGYLQGLPPGGASGGGGGGLADALAAALNKRKQKVSASGKFPCYIS